HVRPAGVTPSPHRPWTPGHQLPLRAVSPPCSLNSGILSRLSCLHMMSSYCTGWILQARLSARTIDWRASYEVWSTCLMVVALIVVVAYLDFFRCFMIGVSTAPWR